MVQRNKAVARRKGAVAAATAGGTVAVALAVASPVVLVVGLGASGYLAWDWLRFRVKNGLKF